VDTPTGDEHARTLNTLYMVCPLVSLAQRCRLHLMYTMNSSLSHSRSVSDARALCARASAGGARRMGGQRACFSAWSWPARSAAAPTPAHKGTARACGGGHRNACPPTSSLSAFSSRSLMLLRSASTYPPRYDENTSAPHAGCAEPGATRMAQRAVHT
jgi:hypothetical protein